MNATRMSLLTVSMSARVLLGVVTFSALTISGVQMKPLQSSIIVGSTQASGLTKKLMSTLRDEKTSRRKFCETTNLLTPFLMQKVYSALELDTVQIKTPVGPYAGKQTQDQFVLVPVMRSGEALLSGAKKYFPEASVAHILVQRDEQTAEAHFKYEKLPKLNGNKIVILEPMLATGGSLSLVIGRLIEKHGVAPEDIIVSCVVAAPEGVAVLEQKFPKIKLVIMEVDEKLNEKKYIVPGLGDFGDRYFGTDG